MGTLGALAISFSFCLSRKSKSWEHGARLGFPFPPACQGKGNHGNMGMRLRFLFPLPVEETAIMGLWDALSIIFPPCLWRKRQSWGGCDSLFPLPVEEKGSIGPSRALQRLRMTPPEHAKSPDCLFPGKVSDQGSLLGWRGSAPSPESQRDLTTLKMRGRFPRHAQGKRQSHALKLEF